MDTSEHLANLQFTPKDEYLWMNEPIDNDDVKGHTFYNLIRVTSSNKKSN